MLIIHIFMIIYDKNIEIGRGVFGIIFGVLIMIYGYSKIKKTTTNKQPS